MTSKYEDMKKAMLSLLISKDWEEIPDEDLWQDGELSGADLLEEIYIKVIIEGKWKLIRRRK